MIDVQIDKRSFDEAVIMLGATPAQVQQATTSALRKMRQRIQVAVRRAAAKELRMPQKGISKRFFSDPVKKGDEQMKIWIGTQPVLPFDLGTVRAYGVVGRTGGVKAGRRTFRGAFLASIYSSRQKPWIRLGSKHYSPDLYPTQKRPGNRGGKDGRFPVIRAAIPIDEIMERVVTQYEPDILDDYERILLQELNYFTNIRPNQARSR